MKARCKTVDRLPIVENDMQCDMAKWSHQMEKLMRVWYKMLR